MEEKRRKLKELKRQYRKTASPYMKRDLLKAINRLTKELAIEKYKKE